MLRIVSENETVPRTPTYRKGYWEALVRVKSIFKPKRSKDEWVALLFVFRQVTNFLETKVKSFSKKESKLTIVREASPQSGVQPFRRV